MTGTAAESGRRDGVSGKATQDSLRPWAAATSSPRKTQCIHNDTWPHNRDALASKTDSCIGTLWHPNRHQHPEPISADGPPLNTHCAVLDGPAKIRNV